jgi:hypothetical protein
MEIRFYNRWKDSEVMCLGLSYYKFQTDNNEKMFSIDLITHVLTFTWAKRG